MPLPSRSPASRGFSILELVAALAILGFAILATAAVLTTESHRATRLAARDEAVHALEARLEDLRAGLIPLSSASFQVPATSATDLKITLDVAPTSPRDLYRVEATARWKVRGRPAAQRLTTLIWRP